MGEEATEKQDIIGAMQKAGAQYGYTRTRRHPSVKPYIWSAKNRVEIFDLQKTKESLARAEEFLGDLGRSGKVVLFVGGKHEASLAIRRAGERLGLPYVSGRWIGGTITNFKEIRRRVDRLLDLTEKRNKGELQKYTKKERLLFDREIEKLERLFAGLALLKEPPQALLIVDPRHEHTAVSEALRKGIIIVALANSDCDVSAIHFPVVANDASVSSISFFVERLAAAYESGQMEAKTRGQTLKREEVNQIGS